MLKKICLSMLLFVSCIPMGFADPLSQEDIAAFDIKKLSSPKFDDRMKVFRIMKHQSWGEKYKKEAITAIKNMLASTDIMQNRTGIQGLELFMYNDAEIEQHVARLAKKYDYKSGNQYFYFRQSLVSYLVKRLALTKAALNACKATKKTPAAPAAPAATKKTPTK